VFERRKAQKLAAGLRGSGDVGGLQRLMQSGSDEERASIEHDLMAAARDRSADVRGQALAALGSFGCLEAATLFLQGLEDEETKLFAMIALGQIREVRAVPKLIAFLEQDPASLEGEIAARALLGIGTPEAIEALEVASHGALVADVREQLEARKTTRPEPE
jgi:hypothetical protein